MSRFRRLVLAVLLITLGMSSSAAANPSLFCSLAASRATPMGPADPDAPAGAPANWLPNYDWVRERWVPFNEMRLFRALNLPIGDVAKYLYTYPAHSLDQLAESRGISPRTLLAQTMGRRPTYTSQAIWRVRTRRTSLVLSQSHLSQHMLFHPFHITQISAHLPDLLGVSPPKFLTLYERRNDSLAQIAKAGGRTMSEVRAQVLTLARAQGRRGVALGAMSDAENLILQDQAPRDFPGFWDTRYGH